MIRDSTSIGDFSAASFDAWRAAARQQPDWSDPGLAEQVREELAMLPPLVSLDETARLRELLAGVVAGRGWVVQTGDCAEDPADCTPRVIARKVGLVDELARTLSGDSGEPVVRVGRIAGQFGKPRSAATELVDGVELPVFRGHMVNSPEADHESRRHDPKRVVHGYWAASAAVDLLRPRLSGTDIVVDPGRNRVWTSHEALLLDYELPMVRPTPTGSLLLTSTHWPWIGDRTRQLHGAHVRLLAAVDNPVACKVGPTTTADELLALCESLDPGREPGRLTLISRMGASRVSDLLPGLVSAVHANGWPVIWLCDPMHGNTIATPAGRKTRLLPSVLGEVRTFHAVVTGTGAVAGGLHLEATPDEVTECVSDLAAFETDAPDAYTTLCDPRLNTHQAVAVAALWHEIAR
ncbi:MAG TPA: 3-deoxy-7-phosphoheptulonate synthase [Actinophytocola sp.]|jgi:3-deoxy-7-phosphoheptulonate synthase|uniref:3-deoxy-7-phosphoheptulonate synthase n=1 Tax=Actinophytocola sp. TaxID=1872138 RepID=UPI002F92322B